MRLHALHVLLATIALFLGGAASIAAISLFDRTPREGTIAIGLDTEVRSLDPQRTTAASDFRVLSSMYEGLVRFAPGSLRVVPGLARAFHVSRDGLTYTFVLRPGVRFHDGTPCDAEAVRASFQRMLDPAHPLHRDGPFPFAFFFERIVRIDAPDARTVVMHLDQPFAPLLSNLAHPAGSIISPTAARAHGRAFGRHPVGTGPFRLATWDVRGGIALSRFDRYHDLPAASATLLFRPVADAMTRTAELRAGGLDLVTELPADNVSWFRDAGGFRVHEDHGSHLWFVMLDCARPPFDDVRVRRALNLAVDKEAIVAHVLQGTAVVPAGPLSPVFLPTQHDPDDVDVAPYPYDPDAARKLLAEAGHAEGLHVTLHAPQSGPGMLAPLEMATAIQADLARIGVHVDVVTHEWNSYLDQVKGGLGPHMEMAEMAWMTHDPDTLPFLALRSDALPPGGFNSGRYRNVEVDALLERARRTHDPSLRTQLYREVQAHVHADAPWLFVASWKQTLVARDTIHGITLDPSFLLRLARLEKR
ncbi:MAG: ABC transporter substrate-binding protein [Polyangiales bacterium]